MSGAQIVKQLFIWLSAILVLAGIFAFLYYFFWLREIDGGLAQYSLSVSETDWRLGQPTAQLILVEYSDFQCPACAYYFPLVKQLIEQYPDKLLFVYRHFPLSQIHRHANLAAYAAEAAGRQGRFWEMAEKLFLNQRDWAESSQARAIFESYASELNLDTSRFLADLDSEAVKAKVSQDYQSALLYRLKGTPTFFLNGRKLSNPKNFEEFRSLIEQGLNN